MRERLKSLVFQLLRKDPEAVVVSFWSGEDALAEKMLREIRELTPEYRHFVVTVGAAPGELGDARPIELEPGSAWRLYRQLRRALGRFRIGLAPVLFTAAPHPLRRAAFLLAPRKILAYNSNLERHHLRPRTLVASLLFLRGVPLDRIFLRPRWLWPWRKDRSVYPNECRELEGRPPSADRKRIAVLSPYFPYPLSHGGAVRIFHLLREVAREFDVFLLAFSDTETEDDCRVLLDFCARVVLVPKPRYREPRWSTLAPPEAREFDSPAMHAALARLRREHRIDLVQVEYTHLAGYGGDILVAHDVTHDLFAQVLRRRRSLAALWDFLRWRRLELMAAAASRRVVVMSEKDVPLLGASSRLRVIENGVDLDRFEPRPESPGQRLLFIGSFRHFPNIEAYRFFTAEVWPELRARFPEMTLTVVCGADHLVYWHAFTNTREPLPLDGVHLLGLISDVRPLYGDANLAIVPTTISAGTNVKVLEAMAMERAVVSTTSGCAGLGLKHGETVWIADAAGDFAAGVARLIANPEERMRMAGAARAHAERNFDWKALGEKQRKLYRELLQPPVKIERVRRRRRSRWES